MAKDTLAQAGVPLKPAGMNDNSPLDAEANWYQTRGVHSLSELCLQRCNGKELVHKYDSPVLAIHGDLRTRIYIETTTELLMLDTLATTAPPDDDMAIESYVLIREQQAQGVNAGTIFGADGYYSRQFNTEIEDEDNLAVIEDTDKIHLQPGTYRFRISTPAYGVGSYKTLFVDDTNGATIGVGSSEYSDPANPTTCRSIIVGRFTIAVETVFRVNYVSSVGRSSDGAGKAMNEPPLYGGDEVEVYGIFEFWKKPE